MPPAKRCSNTQRRKSKKVSPEEAAELERSTTRVPKRRETLPPDQQQLTPATSSQLLDSTFAGLMSDDPLSQLDSTTNLFKLLSAEEKQPPIDDQLVRSGAVPRLIEFLKLDDNQLLQVEAARVLKNVGAISSDCTKVMVDCGAVPLLVKLTESSSDQLREQALWALGNIAADSPEYCGLIVTCGALHPLLSQLNEHNNISVLRTGAWTVANLCRGTPQAQVEQLEPAIPVLASLLTTKDDTVLSEACWALSYLFKGGLTQDPDIFTATTCPKTTELLRHRSPSVVYPAIMVFLSISETNDELVKRVFSSQAANALMSLGPPPRNCVAYAARKTVGALMDRVDDLPFEVWRTLLFGPRAEVTQVKVGADVSQAGSSYAAATSNLG